MELNELRQRLDVFCAAHYAEPSDVTEVVVMPGHAGFAYGFRVASAGAVESWFIRLPPPGVKWVGTADVLRQVAVLNALDGTDVPHCSIIGPAMTYGGLALRILSCHGSRSM